MARTARATGTVPVDTEDKVKATTKPQRKIVPKKVDMSTMVTVLNGTRGRLVYISPRTKERFVWDEFGDEQDMELRELKNVKSAAKDFYEKNWFLFDKDNEWVISYLGLDKYYKNAISIEDFDDVFELTPQEISEKVSKLSSGQKKAVAYRAMELVADRKIDSLKTISALEESLGVELIEK